MNDTITITPNYDAMTPPHAYPMVRVNGIPAHGESVRRGDYDGLPVAAIDGATGPAQGQSLSEWYAAECAESDRLRAEWKTIHGPENRYYFST